VSVVIIKSLFCIPNHQTLLLFCVLFGKIKNFLNIKTFEKQLCLMWTYLRPQNVFPEMRAQLNFFQCNLKKKYFSLVCNLLFKGFNKQQTFDVGFFRPGSAQLMFFIPKKLTYSVKTQTYIPKIPLTETAFNCVRVFQTNFVKHKNELTNS
jgi:hypothetical protein